MDHKEQELVVKELEIAIERLQSLYNQYFMGIEKLEPLIPKKAVERKMRDLRKVKFANTALRFRFQSQVQKYSTHMTHWRRICRQIEEGTYKRDIMRAKARANQATDIPQAHLEEREESEKETPPVFDLEEMFNDVDDAFEFGISLDAQLEAMTSLAPAQKKDLVEPVGAVSPPATRPLRPSGIPIPSSSIRASRKTAEAVATAMSSNSIEPKRESEKNVPPPRPTTVSKRPSPPPLAKRQPEVVPKSSSASASAIDDKKIQSVYRAYVTARTRTNEGTENISLKKISNLLKKTDAAKGGVSDFKVVIRDGKAIIKAVKQK